MAKNIPPDPPYRWHPLGTVYASMPEPGQLIAWRHAAWRVVEVNRAPEADWPEDVRRRIELARTGAEVQIRRRNVESLIPRHVLVVPARFRSNGDPVRDKNATVSLSAQSSFRSWDVYPSGHYPVCCECGEPVPCRAEMARTIGEKAEKEAAKYEIGGACPACREIPTARHKTVTFTENLRVPFGPPVTFHVGRRECRQEAVRYEQELGKSQPGYRLTLSCPGTAVQHSYDPYDRHGGLECSEGAACLGPQLPHAERIGCLPGCRRCQEVRDGRSASIAARNAAGDWTTWA